jgi:hypothetical protein
MDLVGNVLGDLHRIDRDDSIRFGSESNEEATDEVFDSGAVLERAEIGQFSDYSSRSGSDGTIELVSQRLLQTGRLKRRQVDGSRSPLR